MAKNIIQRIINKDSEIREKIKNNYFQLTTLLDSKEIELHLTDTYLVYDNRYIEYKYIKKIKEYINEPTTFVYSGKRYAIIRSPDISKEYYQTFIYALKLKTQENQ